MILICGDSWSCGEWDNMSVTHRGLSGYISEETHHQVVNLGMPGSSNLNTIKTVQTFLNLNPLIKIDQIIVFQTDYVRDTKYIDPGHLASQLQQGYIQFRARRISDFYYNLSSISKKYNIPVYIIGGLSDTVWVSHFSQIYQGVTIACQSFTNLLVNNCDRISVPVQSMYENTYQTFIDKIKNQSNLKEVEELINNIDLGLQRSKLFHDHPTWFYPDGGHPNRRGHLALFEFLCKNKILT